MEKNNIKKFSKFLFIKDAEDNVWKYILSKKHFLKVSRWEMNENRILSEEDAKNGIIQGYFTQYANKPFIHHIINQKWNNDNYEWNYNNEHFIVYKDDIYNSYLRKAKTHIFKHTYSSSSGESTEYDAKYKIVFFNGKLYWTYADPMHYWPQIQLSPFENIDIEPGFDIWFWTSAKYIRPIYSKKYNCYI